MSTSHYQVCTIYESRNRQSVAKVLLYAILVQKIVCEFLRKHLQPQSMLWHPPDDNPFATADWHVQFHRDPTSCRNNVTNTQLPGSVASSRPLAISRGVSGGSAPVQLSWCCKYLQIMREKWGKLNIRMHKSESSWIIERKFAANSFNMLLKLHWHLLDDWWERLRHPPQK